MKIWQQGMKPWLIKYLALPSDVVLELPRITIVGNLHVYVENHQGLITYSETELKLKSNKGYIRITGTSFVLKMMLPEEILLEGMIKEVEFIPE
ncbi:sporulation protein YqfC [Virgibacillus kimchii]